LLNNPDYTQNPPIGYRMGVRVAVQFEFEDSSGGVIPGGVVVQARGIYLRTKVLTREIPRPW
jgi:hypothetical protein